MTIQIYAHRGAWGDGARQNSPESFDRAVEVGADGIECDVRLTRDLIPILSHDPVIGELVIADHSYVELCLTQTAIFICPLLHVGTTCPRCIGHNLTDARPISAMRPYW